jgi:hypothetical protein
MNQGGIILSDNVFGGKVLEQLQPNDLSKILLEYSC